MSHLKVFVLGLTVLLFALFCDDATAQHADDRLYGEMKKAADLEIVFENDSLLVVAKPSGLPSQTTVDPKRPSAEGFVKAMSKTNTGAASPCFLVHRLDADTSGILVFAKSKLTRII